MRATLQIASVGGVPIRAHLSVLLVVAALVSRFGVWGLPAGLVLFGSLLIHELAHAAAGRAFRIPIHRIDLYIFGGMAVMSRPGENPRQELLIAGAGPAASLTLGLLFGLPAWAMGAPFGLEIYSPMSLVTAAAALNLFMGVFNLVPALPMDGGRVFRAALSPRLGHVRATRIAAWVSRCIGAGAVLLGLLGGNWGFIVIGGLLFWLVAHEERSAPAVQAWRDEHGASEPPAGPAVAEELFVDRHGRRYVIKAELAAAPPPSDGAM